ncbi:MAG: DNA primase [Anaerolineae bacterium]
MTVVDQIKDRLDIVDVISTYVPLKKSGRTYKGLCPFHAERTPSFVVFPETGTWHCFGACGTGGDMFTFIMKMEKVDFAEALRILAEKAGILLEERQPQEKARQDLLERLREANAAAAAFFHQLLLHSPPAELARRYLVSRHLSPETIESFTLGYAPNDWEALSRYLTAQGYTIAELLEAGLIVAREEGGHYDRFRNRLMIPIRDTRGRVIGFGARALDDTPPKYLNSPQTPIFDKGAVLFGLDKAAKTIRARGEAIIVEGYMDVMMAHQHGVTNVVAAMGTSLTEEQLRALSRLAGRLVLALDADAAGDQATLRGLNLARQSIGRRRMPILRPDGTVAEEARLAIDLRILTLPAGMDPDELIRQDIGRWNELVVRAQPLVEYVMAHILREVDVRDPLQKAAAVRQMKPILLELQDDIERYHYIQRLARRLMLDEHVVEREIVGAGPARGRARLGRGRRPTPPAPEAGLADEKGPRPAGRRELTLEELCLLYLLRHPRAIHPLSFAFAEAGVPFLAPEDFQRPENRQIFEQIQRAAEEGQLAEPQVLMGQLPAPLAGYLQELLERTDIPLEGVDENEVVQDLSRSALSLKGRGVRQQLNTLRYLLEEAEQSADGEQAGHFAGLIQQYSVILGAIDQALYRLSLRGKRDVG